MKTIHHSEHKSEPFDYDEYQTDDRHYFDWTALIAIIATAIIIFEWIA